MVATILSNADTLAVMDITLTSARFMSALPAVISATVTKVRHNMTERDLLNALQHAETLAEYIRKLLTEKGL